MLLWGKFFFFISCLFCFVRAPVFRFLLTPHLFVPLFFHDVSIIDAPACVPFQTSPFIEDKSAGLPDRAVFSTAMARKSIDPEPTPTPPPSPANSLFVLLLLPLFTRARRPPRRLCFSHFFPYPHYARVFCVCLLDSPPCKVPLRRRDRSYPDRRRVIVVLEFFPYWRTSELALDFGGKFVPPRSYCLFVR